MRINQRMWGKGIKVLCTLGVILLIIYGSACGADPSQEGERDFPGSETPQATESIAGARAPTETIGNTYTPFDPVTPTRSATATLTPAPTETQQPTWTSTLTHTPDPYSPYYIDSLANRTFGDSPGIEIVEAISENNYFNRYLFRYPSDNLTIYGFLNVPNAERSEGGIDVGSGEKYPVVIAMHGYIDPQIYDTIDYTTRYADSLARSGYLVLHPNLRNYPPSDNGENLFRVGMAIDVLNLIELVRQQAGQPGFLEFADPDSIGLWGHSMGGGIATRVMTISPHVDAVVLYGAMSGDDLKNFERIFSYFSDGERGIEELEAPQEVFDLVSPINYLDRVSAAVSIHHGKQDVDVPLAWSLDLCYRLRDLGVDVSCFVYDDMPHTFHGDGDVTFMQRMVYFFDRYLKDGE